jgi:hypothetical protein
MCVCAHMCATCLPFQEQVPDVPIAINCYSLCILNVVWISSLYPAVHTAHGNARGSFYASICVYGHSYDLQLSMKHLHTQSYSYEDKKCGEKQ